ncbi:hypothetical protein L209DRAFT_145915 [Thermothelomyces heterothallicus CBS 203.75]
MRHLPCSSFRAWLLASCLRGLRGTCATPMGWTFGVNKVGRSHISRTPRHLFRIAAIRQGEPGLLEQAQGGHAHPTFAVLWVRLTGGQTPSHSFPCLHF